MPSFTFLCGMNSKTTTPSPETAPAVSTAPAQQQQQQTARSRKWLNAFRQIATIEGISMVILVLCSVLKRTVAPEIGALGVTYVGWAHGLLFVVYVYLLLMCWDRYRWTFSRVAVFFIASLIPFAPFWVEQKLKNEETQPI